LTFGFFSYETFSKNSKWPGFATVSLSGQVAFWIIVLVLVLVAQNTVIAIIGEGYQIAKADRRSDDDPFIPYCALRVLFMMKRGVNGVLRTCGAPQHQLQLTPKEQRWLVFTRPIVFTLAAYFTNIATDGLVDDTPTWHVGNMDVSMDAELSYEELVRLMLHVSGHHHFSRVLTARSSSFVDQVRRASWGSTSDARMHKQHDSSTLDQQVCEAAAAAITHFKFANKAEEVERWHQELRALQQKIKQAEAEL
jgi:hypothetical protein